MSFNIATFNLWKNCGDFPNRIYEIPKLLDEIDCICLQEDFNSSEFSSSKTINKKLNYHEITLPIRKKIRDGKLSTSNLTILSKYKPKDTIEIVFDKDSDDERGALFIQLEHKGKKISILNTHLTNLNQHARIKQIVKLINTINCKKSDLFLICGDMNATPPSKEIRLIKNCGFSSSNDKSTYNEGLILDYIFYKTNFRLENKSDIIIKNLSDHHCLKNSFFW
jgi:endonuclease/exonuclease/phosphatase family metal-dependent hydrolase